MKPRSAKMRFLRRLEASGHTLGTLSAVDGVARMVAFYDEERAEDCEPGGDSLVLNWGTYDWDSSEAFELTVSRHFTLAREPVEHRRRLDLLFRYEPTPTLRALRVGGEWCFWHSDLKAFRRFLARSRALATVYATQHMAVVLRSIKV